MSDGITFESGGRTWRYKDKPRRIEPGEWYVDGEFVVRWPDGIGMKASGAHVPVEPVEPAEPESVELDLSTEDAKAVASFLEGHVNRNLAPMVRAQLREQGVAPVEPAEPLEVTVTLRTEDIHEIYAVFARYGTEAAFLRFSKAIQQAGVSV